MTTDYVYVVIDSHCWEIDSCNFELGQFVGIPLAFDSIKGLTTIIFIRDLKEQYGLVTNAGKVKAIAITVERW